MRSLGGRGGEEAQVRRVFFKGTVAVSCANQTAACFRISRSILNCLFSRRSRLSFSRSSVVSPSVRGPSSRSACRTQCGSSAPRVRIHATVTPAFGPIGPAPPSARETPAGMAGVFLASWTRLSQEIGCPRNGVNSREWQVSMPISHHYVSEL